MQRTFEWFTPSYVIADKGYDSNDNHKYLLDRGITPIIHLRSKPGRKQKGGDKGWYDGIYDKEGAPTCLGQVAMEYVRTNPDTGQHLFRCKKGGCKLKEKGNERYPAL